MSPEVESVVEETIMVFFRVHDVSVQYVLAFKTFLDSCPSFFSLKQFVLKCL